MKNIGLTIIAALVIACATHAATAFAGVAVPTSTHDVDDVFKGKDGTTSSKCLLKDADQGAGGYCIVIRYDSTTGTGEGPYKGVCACYSKDNSEKAGFDF